VDEARWGLRAVCLGLWLAAASASALAAAAAGEEPAAYLFTSFRGNGEDGLHLATSEDGYRWTDLGRSFLKPAVGQSKLLRDPSIAQGPDGTFHMVWTPGWGEKGIGYASSRDLVTWSEQQCIPVMAQEPKAQNAWAPDLFYDAATAQFLIVWATTIPGRFPETDAGGDHNHRLYATTTRDFKAFSPTRLFFDPGFNVIDGTLLKAGGRYILVFKDERPGKKVLRLAFSERAEGPYAGVTEPFTTDWVEGPSAIQIGGEWFVYFDHYAGPHYYGATKTSDFKTWTDVSKQMAFPPGHRHGTVLRVSRAILDGLAKAARKP
jgi:hypothetical protein